MGFVIGLDVGGTFTDCVVIDAAGKVVTDKAFTTTSNTALGMVQAIENAGRLLGKTLAELLRETDTLALGTTILTNLFIKRSGAKIGLLTTQGHEDATIIGRVMAKTDGLPESQRLDVLVWGKPEPLVPRRFIKTVTERIDYKGSVLVRLDTSGLEKSLDELVHAGAEAVAVCFLWSFMNPEHENRAKEIIAKKYPHLYVALSSEVAPVIGEYERAITTLLNAYLGPAAVREKEAMSGAFASSGFSRSLLVMQSNGGVIWDEEVPARPVNILASGPVGGVMQAARMGELLGCRNLIATDMGGTSFDVGLVIDGNPRFAGTVLYERFRLHLPVVEVTSIGAGGGSIAWVDRQTSTLHVGPNSAGSDPGPVCYLRGGTDPTVTDANVALNRISAESFFSGRKRLDREAALRAIEEKIVSPLGFDVFSAAKGILDIVDARMADLIRKLTVERGFDPRDFVLLSYGGAGPAHVGAYSREVGVARALVSPYSPVFSALGIASSDVARHYSKSAPMQPPFSPDGIEHVFATLERRALDDLGKSDVKTGECALQRFINMRFRYQVHEIRVPVRSGLTLPGAVDRLVEDFVALYERNFGAGTALREAGVEMLTFHLVSAVSTPKPALQKFPRAGSDPSRALSGERPIYWKDGFSATPVFSLSRLAPGNRLSGPAVIEAPNTTILIHPEQQGEVDEYLNMVIEF
jgi:N-methylhydantoinase A